MSQLVYITEGQVTDLADAASTMFDALLIAQEREGQITWTALTWNIVVGLIGGESRLAVFDLATANGLEVIHVTNYVNGHVDARPEITR